MIVFFQILLLFVPLISILTILSRKKNGEIGSRVAFFWVVFWLALSVFIMWPNATQVIADRIGIGRGVDLVIYVSIAVLFFLIFRIHIKLEVLNRNITKVVRRETLEENKKK